MADQYLSVEEFLKMFGIPEEAKIPARPKVKQAVQMAQPAGTIHIPVGNSGAVLSGVPTSPPVTFVQPSAAPLPHPNAKSAIQATTGYSSTQISNQYAFDLAKKNGWNVVIPADDELQIDIDTPEQMDQFKNQRDRFEDLFHEIKDVTILPSKSGNPDKHHITVKLYDKVNPYQRIMYQLMLGSDPTREMLSLSRFNAGEPHPTLFFELPPVMIATTITIGQVSPSGPDLSKYPHKCHGCGGPAYQGLASTDCYNKCGV